MMIDERTAEIERRSERERDIGATAACRAPEPPRRARTEPVPPSAWHALSVVAVLVGCASQPTPAVSAQRASGEPAAVEGRPSNPASTGVAAAGGTANSVAASAPAAESEPPSALPGRAGQPSNGFAASSPLNQALPAQIPLAANSAAIVANLAADKNGGVSVWPLMTDTFSAPIYVAAPGTPKRDWKYYNCSQAQGIHGPFAEALANVPTPAGMFVSNGSDGELAIYEPATDTYWDFWRAQVDERGQWSACWGGKIDDYSKNAGVFEPPLGATATGLALGAFLIRIDELGRGHIDHAINIATVRTRAGCQSYPANRNDGNTEGPDIACEGQRFRLDPSFDAGSLESPAARTIAKAMQEYGLILTDKSDALITQAEDPRPHMARNGGKNPYDELFGGVPWYLVLNDIPVERLQALPIDYGKPPAL